MPKYTIGLDYGTNSVRGLLVDVATGREVASAVWGYAHGREGIILSDDPDLARQHPADYVKGAQIVLREVLAIAAGKNKRFKADDIIGIGVDATGSTPLPVSADGEPLAFDKRFAGDLAAMAWLWKDHTAVAEAQQITDLAAKRHPEYLAKCGGAYSCEWFFSKALHCLRTSPKIFNAAYTWVELTDWIPAMLAGDTRPQAIKASMCVAGHKAMHNADWGGYPETKFLAGLNPKLAALRDRMPQQVCAVDTPAGGLCRTWARKTGLPEGIPVAVGAIDAHMGAIGAGIKPGTLVKVLGTSSCDMMVAPLSKPLSDIPGLCGIARETILPGFWGLEAGQAAAGDIYNWFVNCIQPGGPQRGSHEALTRGAGKLAPGASGLLALDWNNGNRNVLTDQKLTGMVLGQTLHTTGSEIYRALVEATAFGALTIIERFEEYRVKVRNVINCGGIAQKNPMVMQIYADVTGREMKVSRSSQTCALGAAMAGAVVAGPGRGGYRDFKQAQTKMTGLKNRTYKPDAAARRVYKKLYSLYRQLHDAFGTTMWKGNCHNVMKDLLDIRQEARRPRGG